MRNDPTGLTMVVRSFASQIKRRFKELAENVQALVASDNVFGLTTNALRIPQKEAWQALQTPEKMAAFDSWFMDEAEKYVLSTTPSGEPWSSFFTRHGYTKGLTRGYVDSRGKVLKGGVTAFFAGSKQEYLRAAFRNPKRLERIRFLATRSYEELKGFTRVMATNLNRVLANGLVMKLTPEEIAKQMVDKIEGMTEIRALMIARTELTSAHAFGQLDAMEDLGETEVGLCAEWTTSGLPTVCKACGAMEGKLFTLEEARGILPMHPNCMCVWITRECSEKRGRRRAAAKAAEKAVKALTGTKNKTKAIRKSSWAGKRLLSKKGGV